MMVPWVKGDIRWGEKIEMKRERPTKKIIVGIIVIMILSGGMILFRRDVQGDGDAEVRFGYI